jgi:hypothetical protein
MKWEYVGGVKDIISFTSSHSLHFSYLNTLHTGTSLSTSCISECEKGLEVLEECEVPRNTPYAPISLTPLHFVHTPRTLLEERFFVDAVGVCTKCEGNWCGGWENSKYIRNWCEMCEECVGDVRNVRGMCGGCEECARNVWGM